MKRIHPHGIRCPSCYSTDTKVIDSRLSPDHGHKRRRRECNESGNRFKTCERIWNEGYVDLSDVPDGIKDAVSSLIECHNTERRKTMRRRVEDISLGAGWDGSGICPTTASIRINNAIDMLWQKSDLCIPGVTLDELAESLIAAGATA